MPDLCARCCTPKPTSTREVFSQPERHFGAVPSEVDAAKRRGMAAHVRQATGLGLMGGALGGFNVSYSLAVPVCTGCEWQIEAVHSNAVWVGIGVGAAVAIGVGVFAVSTTGLTPPALFTPVICGVPLAILAYFLWRLRGRGLIAWIHKGGTRVSFANKQYDAEFRKRNGDL